MSGQDLERGIDRFARDVRARYTLAIANLPACKLNADHQIFTFDASMRGVLDDLLERNDDAEEADSSDVHASASCIGDPSNLE